MRNDRRTVPQDGGYRRKRVQKKHLTAIRSTGADEALRLTPPIIFSLEEAIEFYRGGRAH